MTRINAGFPPKQLCRQHLLAEAREIKRVPNVIKSGRYNMEGMPDQFKLGEGHVKFFYNKLGYLRKRYEELYALASKHYNVTYFGPAWDNLPPELMGDWEPTAEAKQLIAERIAERIADMESRGINVEYPENP